jgi:hypothetical protein
MKKKKYMESQIFECVENHNEEFLNDENIINERKT